MIAPFRFVIALTCAVLACPIISMAASPAELDDLRKLMKDVSAEVL